jgi:L-2-hydroxyglutarate oxidase LhgO
MSEFPTLDNLYQRGVANGLELKKLSALEIREINLT